MKKIKKMWIRVGGGRGSADADNNYMYNIIIKSANMDKGGGGGGWEGKTLIHKMWIKGILLNPSLNFTWLCHLFHT